MKSGRFSTNKDMTLEHLNSEASNLNLDPGTIKEMRMRNSISKIAESVIDIPDTDPETFDSNINFSLKTPFFLFVFRD